MNQKTSCTVAKLAMQFSKDFFFFLHRNPPGGKVYSLLWLIRGGSTRKEYRFQASVV